MNTLHPLSTVTTLGTVATLAAVAAAAKLPRTLVASLSIMALCACSVLSPTATPPPAFYALNESRNDALNAPLDAKSGSASTAGGAAVPATAGTPRPGSAGQLTLIINPPRAAAGFDSQRIIYLREAHKLEYFANSEWVDPPARMLGTLLVSALQGTGAFRAVVLAPGTAVGEVRLETDIIRLQQEFQTRPSRVRFTLRATLLDDKTRRVLAWREFDASVAAPTDDPYGGVLAANLAVQAVLKELVAFCEQPGRNP